MYIWRSIRFGSFSCKVFLVAKSSSPSVHISRATVVLPQQLQVFQILRRFPAAVFPTKLWIFAGTFAASWSSCEIEERFSLTPLHLKTAELCHVDLKRYHQTNRRVDVWTRVQYSYEHRFIADSSVCWGNSSTIEEIPLPCEETPLGNPSKSYRGNPSSQRRNPSTLPTTDANPPALLLSFPLRRRLKEASTGRTSFTQPVSLGRLQYKRWWRIN